VQLARLVVVLVWCWWRTAVLWVVQTRATCFALCCAAVPDLQDRLDKNRWKNDCMVRRSLARAYSNITMLFGLTSHLQMDSVHPTSRPKVKYKRCRHSVKSYCLRMIGHCHCAIMMAHLLVALSAARNGLNQLHFDAESYPIQVDNCCSKCITNDIADMIPTSLVKTSKVVRGFKGEQCVATCHGTIK